MNYSQGANLKFVERPLLITVIVPTFNSERYIIECLFSIYNQTYKNIEILLVDDGSTDQTISRVLKEANDSRLTILQNQRAKGVSGARNTGLVNASGDYICFLDSDDYIDTNCIEKRAEYLFDNPGVNCVFCRTELVGPKRERFNWISHAKPILTFNDFHGNPIHTNAIMFKKAVVKDFQYNEDLTNGEDWLFHAQIARLENAWHRVNGTKAYCRQHLSVVKKDMLGHEKKLERVLEKVYTVDELLNLQKGDLYYNGISLPPLELVKLKRYIALMMYLSFESPESFFKDLSQRFFYEDFLREEHLPHSFFEYTINSAVCRCFLVSRDFGIDFLHFYKDRVLSFLDAHMAPSHFGVLKDHILRILNNYEPVFDVEKFMYEKKYASIIFYPPIDKQEDFDREVLRLSWYLKPVLSKIDRIDLKSDNRKIQSVPEDFAPNIIGFWNEIKPKLNTVNEYKNNSNYAIAIRWKASPDSWIDKKNINFERLFKVDSLNEQHAASQYLKLSSEFNDEFKSANREENRIKFQRLSRHLHSKGFSKSYIFGTGPRLKDFEQHSDDFDSCFSIACNSMVKDKEFIRKIKPNLFVAADPIFHAGCSSYAHMFRQNLIECLNEFPDAYFIVPERDYQVYFSNVEGLDPNRVIGIPFVNTDEDNVQLDKRFYVKVYSNVLTLFLIPLAATFTDEILISGCDGKKELDNQYFWDHNKEVQFGEEMSKIKSAHPSFFNLDYDEYYINHCNALRKQIEYCESKGKVFKNLTESYIPALKERTVKQ